jgi:endonuclease YncB( thermonuclease family)
MRRRLTLLFLLALLCLPALPAAPSAASATGPCVPGSATTPSCTIWEGKVAWVDDGDTLHVRLNGSRQLVHVRITGIQAMELSIYGDHRHRQGACHAVDAADRLEALVKQAKGRVRLMAQDPESRSRGRYRRAVALRINGLWKDVGRTLLNEGRALWLPNGAEYAWNARYSTLAERAAATRVGLWNASYCGEGPNEGQPVKLWANWDADGVEFDDLTGPNGEWARIKNLDPVNPLPLGGWWLRDSDLRQYTFPDYAVVQPGGTLTVHVGRGEDTESDLYWGLRDPVFDNVRRDRESGDGAYLFDPQGDLRSYMTYPCRSTCADANAGALELRAKARGREEVLVRNVSDHAVGLEDYRITASGGWVYAFAPDTVLQPGQTLRLVPARDPQGDGELLKGWGKDWTILRNPGGTVRLSSFRDAVIACVAWGDREC